MALDYNNPYARYTPTLSASAQDFSFGQSIWQVVDGNPDGASVSGVAGISLIDDETGNRRGRDKDKDEGGLSWDDVRDARERMRAEIANITLSNGQFHIFGMDIAEEDMDAAVKDTINNFDDFATKHGLTGQDKDQFQQWLLYYNSLPEGSQEKVHAMQEMATINPNAARTIANNANESRTIRPENQITQEEITDSFVSTTDDRDTFISARAETLDDTSLVGENLAAREGLSVVGTTDLASSFEAGFSAAPEFNAQASGNAQFAQADLQQTTLNHSGPAIATL